MSKRLCVCVRAQRTHWNDAGRRTAGSLPFFYNDLLARCVPKLL